MPPVRNSDVLTLLAVCVWHRCTLRWHRWAETGTEVAEMGTEVAEMGTEVVEQMYTDEAAQMCTDCTDVHG